MSTFEEHGSFNNRIANSKDPDQIPLILTLCLHYLANSTLRTLHVHGGINDVSVNVWLCYIKYLYNILLCYIICS